MESTALAAPAGSTPPPRISMCFQIQAFAQRTACALRLCQLRLGVFGRSVAMEMEKTPRSVAASTHKHPYNKCSTVGETLYVVVILIVLMTSDTNGPAIKR